MHTIDEAIADIKAGRMVIVVDDEDRENEGDLIMAAEHVTPEAIVFVRHHTSGIICAPLTEKRADELGLHAMVERNTDRRGTNFAVSVDHLPTNSTGVSARDRANTIKALAWEKSKPSDFSRPGHTFPLIAKAGGVLRRAGHTEAAVDLARLAGCKPVGVLCEIINPDGTVARMPDLERFAKEHSLKLITIKDLITHRRAIETFVRKEESIALPTPHGTFTLHLFANVHDEAEHHLALTMGDVGDGEPVLVRMHSECLTGDVFKSQRCDCGEQLDAAMRIVAKEGRGVIGYLRQEGRGIGLPAKIKAYALQDTGADTVEANERLGFPADLREYGFGAQMLKALGVSKLRLLTNNPRKLVGLEGYGLEIVERVPLEVPANPHNVRYLNIKRDKMGHLLRKHIGK